MLLNTALLVLCDSEEPFAYYTPENILKFADFLYTEGDYLRAASEYQRYRLLSATKK